MYLATAYWHLGTSSCSHPTTEDRGLSRSVVVNDLIAENGFRLLTIDLRHAAKVETLPFHHRDPFDRLLIAQAISEKLAIVSADSIFSNYGVKLFW
jgi:PIN domain nuclease of toxin-antitoxin system